MNDIKQVLCYDLNLVPQQINIDELFHIAEKTNYLFYDSFEAIRLGCPKPYPYMIDNSEPFRILIDVSTEEGKKIYDKVKEEIENE